MGQSPKMVDRCTKQLTPLLQVGGIEEYALCDAIKSGRLFKPIIAWCIGTCAKMFTSEVQFGHAGACANAERETADAKNKALLAAGAHVPDSFDTLGTIIGLAIVHCVFIVDIELIHDPHLSLSPLPSPHSQTVRCTASW